MSRNHFVFFVLGLLLAGSVSYAVASPMQDADGPPPTMGPPGMSMSRGGMHGPGMRGERGPHRHGPTAAVIMDLHAIERLERMTGRSQDLGKLYDHVLASTQNPEIRHYVYMQLARSQMKPANVSQALVTLRKSLDEDLAHLDKVRKQR